MKCSVSSRCLLPAFLILFALNSSAVAQSVVQVVTTNGVSQLIKDGKPYVIKGVGGKTHLDLLKQCGGNSIRTWSTENLGPLLDEAHSHGLTVCVGMWLGHERHGFNYQSDAAVNEQLEQCLEAVRKYRNHPAVLLWGVGNEMEAEGTNPAIWYAINHIAREIKQIDPNHPVMTVIAELGHNEIKVKNLARYCPEVDLIGINSYGGMVSVAERYRRSGVEKPYVVTEFGPVGPWETGKTEWGAPIEVSTVEKADRYSQGYQKTVLEDAGRCLGSYAFLWGHKQETTATWFGMLLPDRTRLNTVDAMTKAWTGKPPENQAPRIEQLRMEGRNQFKPGQTFEANVEVTDAESDPLKMEWVLRQDSAVIGVGGDYQAEEATFAKAVQANGNKALITVPEGGGGYRLFAYVRDNHGGGSVANVPFRVNAPVMKIPAAKAKLPLMVYGEQSSDVYAPSGYMGNSAAIKMTLDSDERPHTGATCLKVQYKATDNWGGVLWQSPANDWDGEQPGGLNLKQATALEFYIRGAEGNEVVSFQVGGVSGEMPYPDSTTLKLNDLRLSPNWQKVRIPFNGQDASRIKTGFGWTVAGQGRPITFYLDEIRYVAE